MRLNLPFVEKWSEECVRTFLGPNQGRTALSLLLLLLYPTRCEVNLPPLLPRKRSTWTLSFRSLLTHHQWDQWMHTKLILWIILLLFSIIYPDSLADLTETVSCFFPHPHTFIFLLSWSSCRLIYSVADLFHCLSLITRLVYLHCLAMAQTTFCCIIQQKSRWTLM